MSADDGTRPHGGEVGVAFGNVTEMNMASDDQSLAGYCHSEVGVATSDVGVAYVCREFWWTN